MPFRMPFREEPFAKLLMYLAIGMVWTIIVTAIVAYLLGYRSV